MHHMDIHGDITVWYEMGPRGPRPVGYSHGGGPIISYEYPYED
jgi:hypothetical protein